LTNANQHLVLAAQNRFYCFGQRLRPTPHEFELYFDV
jgi:hypothetical protein